MTPPLPATMHAVLLHGHGGFDQLEYRTDVPVPTTGPGEVLIRVTGASGGVGSAAVQLAKCRGAEVIAVASASKTDQVHALGVDRVVTRGTDLRTASVGHPARPPRAVAENQAPVGLPSCVNP